jgi:L-arabinose isomerase
MKQIKIGLLPLYLELYDRISPPEKRKPLEAFYASIADVFRRKGLEVIESGICRLQPEFSAAIKKFETAQVDAIVTLHLAYSPSLESAEALARTRLPVIVLDTTPDYDFSPAQSPDKIMFNHGIHGVQDMCNLLIRNGKTYLIEAGHWQNSDVLARVIARSRAARIASSFRRSRVGQIGKSFAGMGDFSVPANVLKNELGIRSIPCDCRVLSRACSSISEHDLDLEIKNNRMNFAVRPGIEKAHRRSARVGLAVRRWLEQEKLTAFTVNFMDVTRSSGLPTVPFLEAGLGMARGIGYAGEGDVLTAALVGALASGFPETTFTEMFCPDWKGQSIFLSHMGEVNPRLLSGKPALAEYPFIFGEVENPVKAVGCLRRGKAVFVNLAPLPGDQFRLILSPVTIKAVKKGADRFSDTVRGWMKPRVKISDFLADYSRAGGTHHAALVYNADMNILSGFGKLMGWETVVIESSRGSMFTVHR